MPVDGFITQRPLENQFIQWNEEMLSKLLM